MHYHSLENETLVELMPFNALDNDGDEDEQGGQHSSNNPYYYGLSRPAGQWSGNGEEGTASTSFGGRLWQRMTNLLESIGDDARNTSRTHRRSITSESIQYRRRKAVEIALALGAAFLIIIGLEYGVKSIHRNSNHVNPRTANEIQWEADDDSWMNELENNNDENLGFRRNKNAIPIYNMPVNRILCELQFPMFKLLGEELNHLCFRRSKVSCSPKFDSSADPKEVFERDGALYNPDGSKFGQPMSSSFHCRELLHEVWSPLEPNHPGYDRFCQGARTIRQNNVHTNRFCQADGSVDWSKAKELIPECVLQQDNKNFSDSDSDSPNGLTCDGVSWAVVHEQMGGPLDCKELKIAYLYDIMTKSDDSTIARTDEMSNLCH